MAFKKSDNLDGQISRLKDISQKIIADEGNFYQQLVQQFNAVRIQYELSVEDYCNILGIDKSLYHKIITGNRKLTLGLLIRLCRIFDMDLATLTGEAYLRSADSVLRETAILLGRLQPSTIQSISDTINSSDEPDCIKERTQVLLGQMSKLKMSGKSQQPPIFFGSDMP